MDDPILPLSNMNRASPTEFSLEPPAEMRAEIAEALGLRSLRKLRIAGRMVPDGERDWTLQGLLGATAVQECVVSLEPVTTRIDIPVERRYLADLPEPSAEEMEMPDDDTVEPLPARLDLVALITEALSLALPDFPRAEGVELGEAIYAAPGIAPMRDDDTKPLAGLAALRDRLKDQGNTDESDG